jgi:hypothetical protein
VLEEKDTEYSVPVKTFAFEPVPKPPQAVAMIVLGLEKLGDEADTPAGMFNVMNAGLADVALHPLASPWGVLFDCRI